MFLFLDYCHCSFNFCFLSGARPSTNKTLATFCNSWNSWFRFTFSILSNYIWIEFILCSRKWRQYTLILYFYLIIYTIQSTWRSCWLYICYYWTSLYILKVFACTLKLFKLIYLFLLFYMGAITTNPIRILVNITRYYTWTSLGACIIIFLSVLFLACHISLIEKLTSFKIDYHSILFSLFHSKSRILSILFLWYCSRSLPAQHYMLQRQFIMNFKFIIFINRIPTLWIIFIIANWILFFKMIQIIIFPTSWFGYSFHSYTACATLIYNSMSKSWTLIEIIRWEYLLAIFYILPILDSFLSTILKILWMINEVWLKLTLNKIGTVWGHLIFSIIILRDQGSWYRGLWLRIINIINLTLMHSIIY